MKRILFLFLQKLFSSFLFKFMILLLFFLQKFYVIIMNFTILVSLKIYSENICVSVWLHEQWVLSEFFQKIVRNCLSYNFISSIWLFKFCNVKYQLVFRIFLIIILILIFVLKIDKVVSSVTYILIVFVKIHLAIITSKPR